MEQNKFVQMLRTETERLSFYTDTIGPKAKRVEELQKQLLEIANELEDLLVSESLFDINITVAR